MNNTMNSTALCCIS